MTCPVSSPISPPSTPTGCLVQLPTYAPESNPVEGVWSLVRLTLANFVVTDLTGLVRIVKRKLKKIQYRPRLLAECPFQTGLTLDTSANP
ncbi:hypothetical protein [Nonomuraea sp. NPDC049141]|uniref:hypothetical protein n=1 Tax=Nonomuraea sp. NPDC049141 TaxID=3155500 RepID=UPI00340C0767